MEKTELLKNYNQLNNSFNKKMTFHLGANAGFFSEFNNMVLAMLFCLDNKIKFSLYSKKANFSLHQGWNDFFNPFCNQTNFFLHKRYNRRGYQIKNNKALAPTVLKVLTGDNYLTQDIWDLFRNEEFPKKKFHIPELNMHNASLLNSTKIIIKMIWNYNPNAEALIKKFKSSIILPETYISLHIRSGDKIKEISAYDITEYMEKAIKLNSTKKAFVLTDNYSVIDELKENYRDWEFFTLCSPIEKGYIHSEFIKLNKEEKFLQHLKLLASIDICANSLKFIGTYTSNPGMYLGMRLGEDKCDCVDSNSWILW